MTTAGQIQLGTVVVGALVGQGRPETGKKSLFIDLYIQHMLTKYTDSINVVSIPLPSPTVHPILSISLPTASLVTIVTCAAIHGGTAVGPKLWAFIGT